MKAGMCTHYTGAGIAGKTTCKRGIAYRAHVGGPDLGWCVRLPCVKRGFVSGQVKVPCDQYEEPTTDEIAKFDAETDALVQRHMKALLVITEMKRKHKGKNATEIVECPVCGGRLGMTHGAYSGHVWGKCETDGCLSWVE